MKGFLAFLIVISNLCEIKAQEKLDSVQIERISKTCKLWGHLKYFHPYVDNGTVNWEQAFTNNIEDVIKASSKKEFSIAIQSMLSELNDPITGVVSTSNEASVLDTTKYPVISYLKDSVLLFSISDYRDLEDYYYCMGQLHKLTEEIPNSTGVIFDIRNSFELTGDELKQYIEYYFSEIQSQLSNRQLVLPGYRAKFYDGFEAETALTSWSYSSGYYTKGEKTIDSSSESENKNMVFIVNQFSELPRVALALQKTGQAVILSNSKLTDASLVHTAAYELEDSLFAQLRLDELSDDQKLTADYIYPNGIERTELMDIAQEYIKGNTQEKEILNSPKDFTKGEDENTQTAYEFDKYYPNMETRLLAIAKIWTVIDYFFAYKDLMDSDWEQVLKEFIPRFVHAADSLEYLLAVAEMYTHIQDGHGFISSKVMADYWGTASPPLTIRFIEDLPVVVDVFPDSVYAVSGVEIGDIITKVDGEDIDSIIYRREKYRCSSNQSALDNYISLRLANGPDSSVVSLTLRKKNKKTVTIDLPRYNKFTDYLNQISYGGRDKDPILRLINDEIGYADLDRLKSGSVDEMFEKFKDTKAIIFDMRGYPFNTAWDIAPHLTNKKNVDAANFRRYSPMMMKVGDYRTENITIFNQPLPKAQQPYYRGITVMLIDERTQSSAEHTGLFFEAANQTKFIGSQTAGANGDVSNFKIPGNITLYFSGHDVRHIDGRQLQKIGLVPDIPIKPTIEGIRKGNDEVLEKAIEYVNTMIKM